MKKLNLILGISASFVPVISMISCGSSELSKEEFEKEFKKNSSEFTSESSEIITSFLADYTKIVTSIGSGSTEPIKTFFNKNVTIFEKYVNKNKELISKSNFLKKADKDEIIGIIDKSVSSVKDNKDKYVKSYSTVAEAAIASVTFFTDLSTLKSSADSSALKINTILKKYKITL